MFYVVKKGSSSRLMLIAARDQSSAPTRGLKHDSPGASAGFVRDTSATAEKFSLIAGKLGEYSGGSFVEADRDLMPGIYQLGVPDSVFSDGADTALVLLTFPNTTIDPIEISLVAYDPQDEQRLGMSSLGPEGRIAALRGAFPKLTARELVEGRQPAES